MTSLKEQLDKIYQQKEINKQILLRLRNSYIQVAFFGLCKRDNIRKIHKDIRRVTEVYKARYDFISSADLETYVKKLVIKTDKNMLYAGLTMLGIADSITKKWQQDKVFTDTNKIINEKARKEETKSKEKAIKDFVSESRSKKEIFFLCSSHDDVAQDHKDWQNKLYIDNSWPKDIFFKANKEKIKEFIQKNDIKTFQWVTHKPVWMITRPNCRHFFISLTYAEVKNHSIDELVAKYNTHTAVGQKQFQTIRHPINQGWYTKENVEAIIGKYKERLDYHASMYKKVKSDELKRLINKDRLMVNQWVDYYKAM